MKTYSIKTSNGTMSYTNNKRNIYRLGISTIRVLAVNIQTIQTYDSKPIYYIRFTCIDLVAYLICSLPDKLLSLLCPYCWNCNNPSNVFRQYFGAGCISQLSHCVIPKISQGQWKDNHSWKYGAICGFHRRIPSYFFVMM